MKLAEDSVSYASSKGVLFRAFLDIPTLFICPRAPLNSGWSFERLWISVFLLLPVLLGGLRSLSENFIFVHAYSFVVIVLGLQGQHGSGVFAGARMFTGHLTYEGASLSFNVAEWELPQLASWPFPVRSQQNVGRRQGQATLLSDM